MKKLVLANTFENPIFEKWGNMLVSYLRKGKGVQMLVLGIHHGFLIKHTWKERGIQYGIIFKLWQ